MDKAKIEKKLEDLETQRQELVFQVNKMLGEINGRIAALKELLEEEE